MKEKYDLKQIRARETRAVEKSQMKALRVIDMLICNNSFVEDELLSMIYRVAHSASGICLNPHEDWLSETEDLYKKLKGG